MSHFSVLVVTKEKPTDEVLTKALQPFHEFECTGVSDEYVITTDVTEEKRKEYSEETRRMLRAVDGSLHSPYDDKFYREPTEQEVKDHGHGTAGLMGTGCGGGISWTSKDWGDGRGYRAKVSFIPEGMEEVKVPMSECMSFPDYLGDEWCGRAKVQFGSEPDLEGDHKYGYFTIDSEGKVLKVVNRTNPNAKWDYWRIGGRYTGKLQGSGGSQAEASYEWKYEKASDFPEGLDICQKRNLDVAAMKQDRINSRRKWVKECMEKSKLTFDQLEKACHDYRDHHLVWMEMEEPRPRGNDYHQLLEDSGYPEAAQAKRECWDLPNLRAEESLDQWILAAPFLTSFAILVDGEWHANGDMGWWACVSNEKEDWDSEFIRRFEAVDDDCWLTVVDCHI